MSIDWLRKFCLSLPHTTENVQWEDHLVFKVGGKMYAVGSLEPSLMPGAQWLSLKCSEEDFIELTERQGIIPAPYLARAHWVALESETTLARGELQQLLARAHALILAKLSKKAKAALGGRGFKKRPARSRPRRRKSRTT